MLDTTLLGTVDVTEGLSGEGVVLVNTSASPQDIRKRLNINEGKVYTVDATAISLEILGRNLPNMPMIGALIKVIPILSLDTLLKGVRKKFGKK